MKSHLLALAVLAGLSMGLAGCPGPNPQPPTACPALGCGPNCGDAGVKKDSNGCPTCECNPPAYTNCLQDSDCQSGQYCDTKDYCDNPNGCGTGGKACPQQCYGRCEPKPTNQCDGASYNQVGTCVGPNDAAVPADCCKGQKNPCEGAAYDPLGNCLGPTDAPLPAQCCSGQKNPCDGATAGPNGTCLGPNDGPLPPECCKQPPPNPCDGAKLTSAGQCVGPDGSTVPAQCCMQPPPSKCGDGSVQTCALTAPPTCQSPLEPANYKNCVACFEPKTCERQCMSDADCDPGTSCQPDLYDPCNTVADCNRLGVMTCQKQNGCPPVACNLQCANGYVTDANGCQLCQCNPTPPTCACPDVYAPVCGTDGKTYPSDCDAKCANVGIAYMGECGPSCTVTCIMADPVCGADGVTYDCGEPDALCHHTTVAYQGACQPKCTVTCVQPDVVCGNDGVTYQCGEPDALCHNTEVAYPGPCKTNNLGCKADADCPPNLTCFFANSGPTLPPNPGYGVCEPPGYCATDWDCNGMPAPAGCAAGAWSCLMNTCEFACGK